MSFLVKLRYVLFPFSEADKVKELRDWDLFGPLLIAVTLTIIMMLRGTVVQTNHIFAANFLILMFGSSLVTLNAKLVGVKYSFFFYVCVLGGLTRVLSGAVHSRGAGRAGLWFGDNKGGRAGGHGAVLRVGDKGGGGVLPADRQADEEVHGAVPGVPVLPLLRVVHRAGVSNLIF